MTSWPPPCPCCAEEGRDMCLSTVYQLGRPDKPLAKNVALVREQDGKLQFTDILGVVTELEAKILRVDLMENQILVELPAHQGQL